MFFPFKQPFQVPLYSRHFSSLQYTQRGPNRLYSINILYQYWYKEREGGLQHINIHSVIDKCRFFAISLFSQQHEPIEMLWMTAVRYMMISVLTIRASNTRFIELSIISTRYSTVYSVYSTHILRFVFCCSFFFEHVVTLLCY